MKPLKIMALLPFTMVPLYLTVLAFVLALTGCAHVQTPPVTTVKEVAVPYHQPCPKPAEKPVVPKRVAQEHPQMPADKDAIIRVLAAKIVELFGYADAADGVMTACSKP